MALYATNNDENTKNNLKLIGETLSKAMDSVRSSVHDLHDDSVHLYVEIQTLINNFNFCPIDFEYDIESNLEKSLKYCFIYGYKGSHVKYH